jgi:hypothetical protein
MPTKNRILIELSESDKTQFEKRAFKQQSALAPVGEDKEASDGSSLAVNSSTGKLSVQHAAPQYLFLPMKRNFGHK